MISHNRCQLNLQQSLGRTNATDGSVSLLCRCEPEFRQASDCRSKNLCARRYIADGEGEDPHPTSGIYGFHSRDGDAARLIEAYRDGPCAQMSSGRHARHANHDAAVDG